jgi:hypothetical protein
MLVKRSGRDQLTVSSECTRMAMIERRRVYIDVDSVLGSPAFRSAERGHRELTSLGILDRGSCFDHLMRRAKHHRGASHACSGLSASARLGGCYCLDRCRLEVSCCRRGLRVRLVLHRLVRRDGLTTWSRRVGMASVACADPKRSSERVRKCSDRGCEENKKKREGARRDERLSGPCQETMG